MKHVPVTMIWWTHELRRSWSDNIRAVGSGGSCGSWWRRGVSWTPHVRDRRREVLWRCGWRWVILPAVIVREAIRSWDFTRWAGVPVASETWTVWNACNTGRARGRGMNRANVGYVWTWVTRRWSCWWFCKVGLLVQEIMNCAIVSYILNRSINQDEGEKNKK